MRVKNSVVRLATLGVSAVTLPVIAALGSAWAVQRLVPAPTAAQAAPPIRRVAKSAPPSIPVVPAYPIRSALVLDKPLRHGDWVWRVKAGPARGAMLITVDLAAETLSVFRDGHEIGVAAIHYGANTTPSPLGRFPIKWKDANHHSRTYDNAPMPYTLRLTDDGVAIHGADVDGRWGTHGCIGVPTPFAKLLFGAVAVGDPVIVTRGATLKVGEQVPAD